MVPYSIRQRVVATQTATLILVSSYLTHFVHEHVQLRNAIAAGWTPSRKDAKAVLQHAMSQGWWELSHKLVEYSRSLKVDLTASVYQSAASIRGRLKSLEEALRGAKSMSRL